MDPRRRIDEKYSQARLPDFESYTERVLEDQPLGAPVAHDIIVIRLKKSALKLYSSLALFTLLIVVITIWQSGE